MRNVVHHVKGVALRCSSELRHCGLGRVYGRKVEQNAN